MRAVSLLSVVARIHPQVWDAIIPHGPRIHSRAELVSLNPQPLPPREEFLVGAAVIAHDFVRMAVETEIRGESSVGFVSEWVDGWCATPWPRNWPWPWPGPRPDEGPSPEPWDIDTGRIVGAIVLASVGSRLAQGDLRNALLEGADRLAEAAIGG